MSWNDPVPIFAPSEWIMGIMLRTERVALWCWFKRELRYASFSVVASLPSSSFFPFPSRPFFLSKGEVFRLRNMDSKHQHPTVEPTDEKPPIVAHLEDKSELGPDKHAAAADYTGAERKSDPEEIALVRKINWRLMVRTLSPLIIILRSMTNLRIANTMRHVLSQLRRSQCDCAGAVERSGRGSRYDGCPV